MPWQGGREAMPRRAEEAQGGWRAGQTRKEGEGLVEGCTQHNGAGPEASEGGNDAKVLERGVGARIVAPRVDRVELCHARVEHRARKRSARHAQLRRHHAPPAAAAVAEEGKLRDRNVVTSKQASLPDLLFFMTKCTCTAAESPFHPPPPALPAAYFITSLSRTSLRMIC